MQRTDRCLQFLSAGLLKEAPSLQLKELAVPPYSYSVSGPGTLVIGETGESIRLNPLPIEAFSGLTETTPTVAYLDADCLEFPLTIRNMKPGDRFSPLGTEGTQKLKKFFCDHKIPPARRKSCPLLLSRNKIIWVAGQRIDNAVKLTKGTTRILKVELVVA